MSETIEADAEVVHYHDCPMFGNHTKVMHAYMLSTDRVWQLGSQLKCLCGYTAGPFIPAPGVTVIAPQRYTVDPSKAIRVQEADHESIN